MKLFCSPEGKLFIPGRCYKSINTAAIYSWKMWSRDYHQANRLVLLLYFLLLWVYFDPRNLVELDKGKLPVAVVILVEHNFTICSVGFLS